jgi:hypothetical protein
MGQVSPGSAIVSGGVTLPGPVLAMIEARNALARTVFFHLLGETRNRSYENQRCGPNLVIAESLWSLRARRRSAGYTGITGRPPRHDRTRAGGLGARQGGRVLFMSKLAVSPLRRGIDVGLRGWNQTSPPGTQGHSSRRR